VKKILKWIFGLLVAAFAVLQFTNPACTNPPVSFGHDLMDANPPPLKIAAMLHSACYDCHSYKTKWPWYSRIAPASWLVTSDVNHGRERLNFSEWPRDFPERAAKRWEDVSEELDYNEMPPAKYTLLHPEARLSAEQRKQLSQWADQEATRLKSSATVEK
jgi:hypothetical protein